MRMLRFGGPALQRPQHTWFEDFRGGIVRADVGRIFSRAEIQDPDYYVENGMAVEEGIDDGSTGKTQTMLDDLRALAVKHELIAGDSSTYTLQDIVAACLQVAAADELAIAAFEAARETGVIEDAQLDEVPAPEELAEDRL